MTQEEAKRLPFMNFTPDKTMEDCFYYRMYLEGRLGEEQGKKAHERLRDIENLPVFNGYMDVAGIMIENLDRYGFACAAWCDGTPTPRKKLREMYVKNVDRTELSRAQAVYILSEEAVKKVNSLEKSISSRPFWCYMPDVRHEDVEEFVSILETPEWKLTAYYYQTCDDYEKGKLLPKRAHHYSITYHGEEESD
jgi:hypothetical protein